MSGLPPLAVLNMDEEGTIAGIGGAYLRKGGHHVTTVETLGEIATEVRERPVELLVIDGTVDGRSTTPFCALLRAGGFDGLILVASGFSDAERVQAAIRAGVDDWIVKPFTADELLSRVDLLRSSRSRVQEFGHAPGAEVARLADEAATIVRELRPGDPSSSNGPTIGDNGAPSDLPLTARQADEILAALRDIKDRLDSGETAAPEGSTAEARIMSHMAALGTWLARKVDIAAEEAAKTGGKLLALAVAVRVAHLQHLLSQLLAHLRAMAGH